MRVLILGSGGREHAIAWKIAKSDLCTKLFVAPGNAGTIEVAQNLDIDILDFKAVERNCLDNGVNLVIVGPEAPLVAGIYDFFKNSENLKHIPILGPGKMGAQLEGSKDFAKAFMLRHNIPTAKSITVTKDNLSEGISHLEQTAAPYVLKADGLAAGKGVLILDNRATAIDELQSMLFGKFGDASKKVVIEAFLSGIELSVFVLTDGNNYVILPEAKDYKRIGDGDTGLNTGGMGAVSPVNFADASFMEKVEQQIISPTINGLKKEGFDYRGFIFFGLIKVGNNPFVIEYNVRLGDPETEVVLERLDEDLLQLIAAAAKGELENRKLNFSKKAGITLMQVSGGYPEAYEKGKLIKGLENVSADVKVFHCGTKIINKQVHSSGGRVLTITALGKTINECREKAYLNSKNIQFDGKYQRQDIGKDLL